MGDDLNSSSESIEIAEISSSASASRASSSVQVVNDAPEGVALRGNALYARLAVLMGPSVSKEAALKEMGDMMTQIDERKKAAGVSEMWDAGEEVGEAGGGGGGGSAASSSSIIRPPPKRTGPPAPVVTGSRGILSSPMADRSRAVKGKAPIVIDKSSSSGSEESNDAPLQSGDRAKASASEIPKASNKLCIICHESSSAILVNPLLTCSVCTLPTHAKCAKPVVEKEDIMNPRFIFSCASCTRRPRSESPKPRSIIQITTPHEIKRRKTEDSPKLSKSDEAKRKRLEAGEGVRKKKSEDV